MSTRYKATKKELEKSNRKDAYSISTNRKIRI